jgi:hypothetical protein
VLNGSILKSKWFLIMSKQNLAVSLYWFWDVVYSSYQLGICFFHSLFSSQRVLLGVTLQRIADSHR